MPKIAHQISDVTARSAKSKDSDYTIASGNGLHLQILKSGRKQWLVRYRTPEGQRGKKVLGIYPEMGVADAQKAVQVFHLGIRSGGRAIGMHDLLKAAKQERTEEELQAIQQEAAIKQHRFDVVASQWLEHQARKWASSTYVSTRFTVLQKLCPAIGQLDVRTMRSPDVIPALRAIEVSTPSLAHKARQHVNSVITYAIQMGMRDDGQLLQLKGIFSTRDKGNFPAITKVKELAPLLRAIQSYPNVVVRNALWLTVWTAVRPGVVAGAPWTEMDLERQEWHIPARRMKTKHDHIVSLPHQAVAMLVEMRRLSLGEYVFPATGKFRNDHLNRDSLSKALRAMGFQGVHTPHGFRASLRTLGREKLKADRDVLEAQLAHAKKDEVQAAYDRTEFTEERINVMQQWADFLDELMADNVVAFKQA